MSGGVTEPVSVAARARRATTVLGRLSANEIHRRYRRLLGGSRHAAIDASHTRAVEFRRALEDLGPFFIKVGQMLSTRPDIVSESMTAELRRLHDEVSPAPFSTFEPVLRADLGADWCRRFRHIDTDRPLGAASLAQAYRASLHDGTDAVVKIQRPGVRAVVHADMVMMRRMARFAMRRAPRFAAVVDVEAMLGVLFDAMRPELDFRLEAQNMTYARTTIARFRHLTVPAVVEATPRVLIQGFAPGRSIRHADHGDFTTAERLAIGRDLLAYMYRGYFVDRFFHADPHPGNILVHPGRPATLIDWGMVGRIDRHTSLSTMLVLLSLAQNDGHALASAWAEMGHATEWADLAGFAGDMAALVPRIATASLAELNFGVTLTAVLERSTHRGIRTNPAISLLGKSFANIEGSVRHLAPELGLVDVFEDVMQDILLELARETTSRTQTARTAVELMISAATVPGQLRGVLRDVANRDNAARSGPRSHPASGIRGHWPLVAGAAAAGWLLHRQQTRRHPAI